MKKILFVFNHPAPYKVRFLNELAKFYDLTVIFERNGNKDRSKSFYFENKYAFKQVHIKGVKLGNENFISNGVKSHLKHNKYDLVIMNGYSTLCEMKALNFIKKHHIKYAFYINGGIINKDESSLKRKIKTHFIKGADFYFSPDEESNKYLVYYGADKNKIFNYAYSTIYEKEIVSKALSKDEKIRERKNLHIPFENVFVSSGQLIERKNYLKLISVWKDLPNNYGLYIFGDGKQRARIQKYIKDNNVQNVMLEGFKNKEEMFKFFRISDAFVFPSKEDIYGHVINEAFSQGLPVISTTNVNSAKKLIKSKVNGEFINSVCKKELTDAINVALKNDLSKEAIKTAKENTIEKMLKDHIEALEGVLK